MIFFVMFCLTGSFAFAEHDKNYFRAPSPSPFVSPGFEKGDLDAMVTGGLVFVSTKNDDLFGADAGVKGRYAFDDTIAVDGGAGFAMLGGKSEPGLLPRGDLSAYTVLAGSDGTVFSTLYRMNLDVEVQLYNSSRFGLIFFIGPNFNLFYFRRVSDYSVVSTYPLSNKYTDRQNSVSVIGGFQSGLAFNIPLKNDITLCPVFMIAPFMGIKHIHDNTGRSGIPSSSSTIDVPSTTTVSFGMNVKWRKLSFSPLVQVMQLSSENSSRKDQVWSMAFTVGYYFFSNKM